MVCVLSDSGQAEVLALEGNAERITADVGAAAHKVLLTAANTGAKSAEEVIANYKIFAQGLISYIETTIEKADETGADGKC